MDDTRGYPANPAALFEVDRAIVAQVCPDVTPEINSWFVVLVCAVAARRVRVPAAGRQRRGGG